MKKSEKQIYLSGRKNNNGYKFHIKIFKKKSTAVLVFIVIILTVVFSFLDFFNIISINKIYRAFNVIDGVQRQDDDFAVYYLDVGQGNCSVIICEDKVLMIDTGTVNQSKKVKESLKCLDIDTIDYLVITHQHDDHMGNAEWIISDYSVKNIVMPKLPEDNQVYSLTYKHLLNAIAKYKVNPIAVNSVYGFQLGSSNIRMFVADDSDKDLNDNSIVTRITYQDTSFIFTGDAEKNVEKQLLRSDFVVKSDVILIGHHGSANATSEEFIKEVDPSVAVISCGEDNSYGHPRNVIVDRILKYNIDLYITSDIGDVTIISDGKNVKIIE